MFFRNISSNSESYSKIWLFSEKNSKLGTNYPALTRVSYVQLLQLRSALFLCVSQFRTLFSSISVERGCKKRQKSLFSLSKFHLQALFHTFSGESLSDINTRQQKKNYSLVSFSLRNLKCVTMATTPTVLWQKLLEMLRDVISLTKRAHDTPDNNLPCNSRFEEVLPLYPPFSTSCCECLERWNRRDPLFHDDPFNY